MPRKPSAKTKLKPAHEILVNEVAKGTNQTKAYMKAYPNASYNTARSNAPVLLAKHSISEALQSRINRALKHNNVTPEEIIGSAAFQMRSSPRDVTDNTGNFDFEKACETGAIDLVKKLKKTKKRFIDIEGNITETETVEFEMLSNQDGRKEVAEYQGMGFGGKANTLEKMLLFVLDLIRSDNISKEDALWAAKTYLDANIEELEPYVDAELIKDQQ